jgi:hypothetical protein
MTAIRALNELQAAGLGELCTIGTIGRERYVSLGGEPRAVWTSAEPYLRRPVIKRASIEAPRTIPAGKRGGLTALAELTMLAPPERPTHALGGAEWIAFHAVNKVIQVPSDDPGAVDVQMWSYPPKQLSDGDLVDPLSLYLSLKDTKDERVEAALEELLEKLPW